MTIKTCAICPKCGHSGLEVDVVEAIEDRKLDIVCTCPECDVVLNEFVTVADMMVIEECA